MNGTFFPFFDHKPSLVAATAPEGAAGQVPPNGPHTRNPWLGLIRWLQENTFSPEWLPERLRHPLIGYLVTMLIEGIAVSLILLLLYLFPSFAFHGIITVVGVVLVALGWGAGPALFATLVGTCLLYYVVLPPHFSLTLVNPADGIGLVMYLAVGAVISLLAGRNERARQRAEKTSQLLEQAETRSRIDAEHLRAVLDVLPAAVLIASNQGRVLTMNQAARTLWASDVDPGADITQYAQNNGFKVWSAGSSQPLPPKEWPLARALSSGDAVLNDELEFEAADGQRKVLLNSAAPIRDETGAMTGAVMLSRDVTERRLLERKVAEHAQELEAIFEAMTDGIALLDAQGAILRTNQAFRSQHGVDQESDYLTLPLRQRLTTVDPHGEHRQMLEVQDWPVMRLLRGETLTGVDVSIRNLRGREIVFNVSGAPMHDQRGHITGCVEVFRDVTARQHLEQRTRETLGTLVAMAEAMVQFRPRIAGRDEVGDPAVPLTTDTTLSQVARHLAELTQRVLGCRRVSIAAVDPPTGRLQPVTEVGLYPGQEQAWWASWFPPQHLHERYGMAIAAALSAGEPALLDLQHLPERSWSTLFGAQSAWLVPMQLGEELVGILLVDYLEPDHASAGQDERLLTTTLAQLGALVLERDRLLRGWAETRANELALAETKAQMDTFLSIASHELKTPLTSLKLSLQLSQRRLRTLTRENPGVGHPDVGHPGVGTTTAEDAGLLPRAVEQLSRTAHQVQRMESLVNDLVDVSRIQAGQLELRTEPTDLVARVQEVIDGQQEAAPQRRILLQSSVVARTVPVEVDAGRIEQVVTNFLTNALKYSPADRPVEVGVEVEPEGRHVRVWVRDHGPGLPADEQEQIWERFHRARGVEVQSGAGVGLGLGLYISRMIVERHHGQVGVHSVPGQGSTFWFTLPLSLPEPEASLPGRAE